MLERVINKTLNKQGWFWAFKFDNKNDAFVKKKLLDYGSAMYYESRSNKRPYWILTSKYNI